MDTIRTRSFFTYPVGVIDIYASMSWGPLSGAYASRPGEKSYSTLLRLEDRDREERASRSEYEIARDRKIMADTKYSHIVRVEDTTYLPGDVDWKNGKEITGPLDEDYWGPGLYHYYWNRYYARNYGIPLNVLAG